MNNIKNIIIPITILLASIILGSFYYFTQINKQKIISSQDRVEFDSIKESQINQEELINQKKIENDLSEIIESETEKKINQCITDAYIELKTLQENNNITRRALCLKNNCDLDFWEKANKKAFDVYQNEWVPQCKLGNRVFIDYTPYNPEDFY